MQLQLSAVSQLGGNVQSVAMSGQQPSDRALWGMAALCALKAKEHKNNSGDPPLLRAIIRFWLSGTTSAMRSMACIQTSSLYRGARRSFGCAANAQQARSTAIQLQVIIEPASTPQAAQYVLE